MCAQSCLTLCNPVDSSLPGSSLQGILQERTLGCHFLLQEIFPTQGSNLGLLHWQAPSLPLSLLGSPNSLPLLVFLMEKATASHSSTLAWKIPWTEEPGRLQSMGLWESDTTEQLHFHFLLSCTGEGNGNPLQCSCLENPRDGGAWWAAFCGVAQSRTKLKWLSSSSSSSSHSTVEQVVSSVQSLSLVQLFVTPWTAAHQVSLSITNSQNLLKLMSIELVMPSNHLILCRPLLLQPSVFPRIRVFSNESVLCIRWSKYWSLSFSSSPSNEHWGLISFKMDWLDLLAVQGTLKSLLQHHSSKAWIFLVLSFLCSPALTSILRSCIQSHHFMANRWGNNGSSERLLFFWTPKSL